MNLKNTKAVKEVLRLERLYFPGKGTTLASLRKIVKDGGHIFYLYDKRKLVGYVLLSSLGVYQYQIETIVIIPGYRNTGGAKHLLNNVRDRVIELGGTIIFTYVSNQNIPSLNLFIKQGYRISSISNKWVNLYYTIN